MSTHALAKELIEFCKLCGYRIVTAESCTGGGVAATLSSIAGSSAVLWGGVVVYDRAAKVRLLGLSPSAVVGAKVYSREVASNMAYAAHALTGLDKAIALGVTGVAGPGSDCGVQAGTVHLAAVNTLFVYEGKVIDGWDCHERKIAMGGSREEVRDESVRVGLLLLLEAAKARRRAESLTELSLAV